MPIINIICWHFAFFANAIFLPFNNCNIYGTSFLKGTADKNTKGMCKQRGALSPEPIAKLHYQELGKSNMRQEEAVTNWPLMRISQLFLIIDMNVMENRLSS